MDRDPVLQGELVVLRPLELLDAEAATKFIANRRRCNIMEGRFAQTLDETRRLIEQMLQVQANGTGFRWVILQRTDSEVAGSIGYHGWDRNRGFAFFSYEVVPKHRGKRLSVDAGRVAIAWGDSQMGLRRILAVIDSENRASLATAIRLGFTLEVGLDPHGPSDHLNRCTYSLCLGANAIPSLEFQG